MLLEQVARHETRDDVYLNKIITPHGKVKKRDRMMVNRILYKEIAKKYDEKKVHLNRFSLKKK